MDPMENRDIMIEGRRFRDMDDLEDFCSYFPEFEDDVIDSGLLSWPELVRSVNTYLIVAEIEYGDGNWRLPFSLHSGWYGEVLLGEYC